MKRKYIPYYIWEDYLNGMYSGSVNQYDSLMAVELLTDQKQFYSIGLHVLNNWPNTCLEHLTNTSINRIAWIGQACCNYIYGCNEISVKQAWKNISLEKQLMANHTAKLILDRYETFNYRIHKKVGTQLLLQWNT